MTILRNAQLQITQRGFAGAAGTDHRMTLARGHLEIKVTDDLKPAEGLAQVSDFERAHCRYRSACRDECRKGVVELFGSGDDCSQAQCLFRSGHDESERLFGTCFAAD